MQDSSSYKNAYPTRNREMPRKKTTTLTEISDAAITQLTCFGYRQTQMADIAKSIGISAGTLYHYVENKEAMLGLAAQRLTNDQDLEPLLLPFKSIPRNELADAFMKKASTWARWPTLKRAIENDDIAFSTLVAIGEEIYDLIARHKAAILFLDRIASELYEIAPVHVDQVRGGVVANLTDLLDAGGSSNQDRHALAIVARGALEILSWAAMHRHREGHAAQAVGSLSEDDIRGLASRAFAGALQASLQ